jgi:hypothetical protein
MILDNETAEPFDHPPITFRQVFIDIWAYPRKTHELLYHQEFDKHFYGLLAIAGMVNYSNRVFLNAEDYLGLSEWMWWVIKGCVFGMMTSFVWASILSFTGSWIGGKGDFFGVLRAISYSSIPLVPAFILAILQVILGYQSIQATDEGILTGLNIAFAICGIAMAILWIWNLVLIIIGISVVHQFSVLKSILTVIIPFIILFIVLYIAIGSSAFMN